MKFTIHRACLALILGAAALPIGQSAFANTPIFAFTNRDVLVSFRQAGANNDLEVNVGPATRFSSASPGSRIVINSFTTAQLNDAFSDLNDLSWSAGAAVRVGDGGDSSVPVGTLWVTAPRQDPNIPATPWARQSASTLAATGGKIKSILDNASFYSGTIAASSESNTVSSVFVSVGSGHEYGFFMGPLGNYGNTFYGDVENTTPPTFSTDGVPSRSDFYELLPDNTGTLPSGQYLGYFELGTDGSLSFVAGASVPPAPNLTITAVNGVQTISFPTVNGATYTLHYTDAAGLTTPIHNWSTVSTNISGNGNIQSFQQNASDAARFYTVSTQ